MVVNIARLHQQAACKLVIHCFKYNIHLHSTITNYEILDRISIEILRNENELFNILCPLPAASNI